jgi:hypothetical protein
LIDGAIGGAHYCAGICIDGPHPGVAQFALLQMDQTDLPPELRGKPFNLSVGLASTLVDESK